MGIWFPDPELDADEVVSFQAASNLFRGKRTIGGLLSVTDHRLVFVPNRLDGVLGGKRTEISLADITGIRVEEPGTETARKRGIGASIHPQVEIRTVDNLLVITVSKPALLAAALGATYIE